MEQTFHYTIFAYSIFFKGNCQIFALYYLFITYLLPILYVSPRHPCSEACPRPRAGITQLPEEAGASVNPRGNQGRVPDECPGQ